MDGSRFKIAERIVKVVKHLNDDDPLYQALLNRIVKPQSDNDGEFRDLESHLRRIEGN